MDAMVKALGESYGPFQMMLFRSTIALVPLYFLFRNAGGDTAPMEPRRRNRLLLLAAVVFASVPCILCALPIALFVRSPSPRIEGRTWTAEDAAYQLVDRG